MKITITNRRRFIRFLKEFKLYVNFKNKISFKFNEENGVVIPVDFWEKIFNDWAYWCLVLDRDNNL